MEGPRGSLSRVLPLGAGLRALYLGEDGIACVDLDAGFVRGLSGGSEDALIAIWSLADTLAVNFAEVRSVKILIEGEEVRDLGGHLDLSRPLVADMSLVDEGGGAPQAAP
jgi:germination protein M